MSITIILPDNKRLNIKATIHSLLSEILEKVCNHKGLDSSNYTFRRSNRPLDLSLSLRLASIPLNSELNLVFDPSKDVSQKVSISIQYQDRPRKTGQFSSAQTLWQVIESLFAQDTPQIVDQSLTLSINYMNKQFEGREVLEQTTLKLMGLINGRVMFRMDTRPADSKATQKFVENLVLKKPEKSPEAIEQTKEKPQADRASPTERMQVDQSNVPSTSAPQEKSIPQNLVLNEVYKLKESAKTTKNNDQAESAHNQPHQVDLSKEIKFLGGQNSELFYSIDDSPKFVEENQSDDFFNHTAADLKHLLKELKRQQTGNTDAHLEVNKTREERDKLEREKFDQTIIRVVFPYDKLILQAFFKPTNSVDDILKAVQRFTSTDDIYLFTTPPKEVLPRHSKLVDLKLVPTGLIYCCSTVKPSDGQLGLIKEQFKAEITPFVAASQLAIKEMKSLYKKSREKTNV